MAENLLLIRHAATASVNDGRYIGATDEGIVAPADDSVARLVSLVQSFGPERCLASPMLRTRQTAALVTEPCGLEMEIDADLREIDFGNWEGLTFAEIDAQDPVLVRQWATGAADFCFPGGEPLAAFHARVREAGRRLAGRPEKTVVAVSHGGVIRILICHFLGLSFDHYLQFEVRPFAITVIRLFGERGVLAGLNLENMEEKNG